MTNQQQVDLLKQESATLEGALITPQQLSQAQAGQDSL